jgi:methionyl-tRNA formyltransferase
MAPLRIVFAGTPEFAARHLDAVLQTQHNVVAVYTRPDQRAGRGKKLRKSPVKSFAEKEGLVIVQPKTLRDSIEQARLKDFDADVIVVVAYGAILPKTALSIPKLGCINVHASLLPRWRGAAPIERALLAGDKVSGVTIMAMDEGLDTGDILLSAKVDILDVDTREDLENKLVFVGRSALVESLSCLAELLKNAIKQDDTSSCYATKLEKHEALIDWACDAVEINRKIRAGAGRYPAFTFLGDRRLRVISAAVEAHAMEPKVGVIKEVTKESFTVSCGHNRLRVYAIQLAGKRPVSVRDSRNADANLLLEGRAFKSSPLEE